MMEQDYILEEELKEIENNYENYKKDIVSKLGYLLGIKEEYLKSPEIFDQDVINEIDENENAKRIRALSVLRSEFIKNFKEITDRRNNLVPLDTMHDLISVNYIKYLRDNGTETMFVNQPITMHIAIINQYILDNIDKIKALIPEWIKWDYVKPLFLMPKCYYSTKGSFTSAQIKKITTKINKNRLKIGKYSSFYPFQTFINWDEDKIKPYYGNILFNDAKFLKLLYSHYGDTFHAEGYVIDATAEDKNSIYYFVDEAQNLAILVDCENVDPYRFASVFLNLEEENLQKIKKVILYDDENTSEAWDYIGSVINIPVEHHEIKRLLDNKSLVDIAMTAGACKEYYKDNTESMILASSDSDFWGLINSLSDVRFYVLNESGKTSDVILQKLDEYDIDYCFMDSFAQEAVQDFKNRVLLKNLQAKIDEFNETGTIATLDARELVDMIFFECRICGSQYQINDEKDVFYNKYIKKRLKLSIVELDDGTSRIMMELSKY